MMANEKWHKRGSALLDEMRSTNPPEGCAALWYLGQAGFVIKGGGKTIFIDPFLDPMDDGRGNSQRLIPPPFSPCDVTFADYVLCTHDHSDHLDPFTLTGIANASPDAYFVVPAPHVERLASVGINISRIVPAREDARIEFLGCRIIPNGCPHDAFETDADGDHAFMGYTITAGGVTVHHSGDTSEWPEMRAMLRSREIDVLLLPINGNDWERKRRGIVCNISAREASDIGADSGADIIIPMHFDMFAGNTENPAVFADYMHRERPAVKWHVMTPGERFFYVR